MQLITISQVNGLASSLGDKLASSSYTAADVLSKLLTVDGAGTNLDADLLDGQQGSYYLSATNLNAGTVPAARMPALTGDITTSSGAVATSLATVNSNVGSFGSATQVATFTVNAKGLTTAASNVTITPAWSSITSKPTTLSGYGITDAAPLASPTFTGTVTSPNLYFTTYGGGWTMSDTSWVRSYNNKGILTGGTVEMGAFTVTSDRRLKTEIVPLTGYSEFVDSANVYSYVKNGKLEWGIIAQEVQEGPAPHLVQEGGSTHEDGSAILTVDDHSVMYAMLAELKSLRARVAELEANK